MEDSKIQEHPPNVDEFLGFDCKNIVKSQQFITGLVKCSFLFGADKMLLTRKSSAKSIQFDCRAEMDSDEIINKTKHEYKKVCEKPQKSLLQSNSNSLDPLVDYDNEFVDVSKVVNSHSGSYNEFPLNILGFLAILVLRFVGFQMNLFLRFFTLPVWLTYFSLMFLMFPFQTLSRIRHHFRKKIVGIWVGLYLSVTSFICDRIKAQKSLVKLGIRFGWAFLGAIYVCFILVGLLMLGFIIGIFTINCLVEKPIQVTETLNFDYTKASPVALVPIGVGPIENVGTRAIPYNHKLKLTVSLTMPESDYNRKLGIFQVRVEILSSNGKTSATASYPCMLKFKSQPIRVVETVFKSVPLIAGFQSEVQILDVNIDKFTEGNEPTTSLRVVLEQRAEYQSGAGIPEIYSALLDLQSELPRIKRIIWRWRRTLFVWISMMAFLVELVIMLILCKTILLPRGRLIVTGAKKHAHKNKISWY